MKNSTLPAIRVEPKLRAEVQTLLGEGETISAFVEHSVREAVSRRQAQTAFVQKGLGALTEARSNGDTVTAEEVMNKLKERLVEAKGRLGKGAL